MRICPVSFYHYEPKIQPAARKHQNVPPSFTGDYYPGIYNDFCKVSPDFRYKVPEKIFQTIDSMYEKEYGIHSEFKKVDSWQSRKISNWEWERIGYKNNKVFIVHRGVESDFSDDPEDILDKYIALYDYKGNKTLEMEYMPPPRVGRGGFITAKRDYYPNSSLVEYEILNEPIYAPFSEYTINHYSPYGTKDKQYKIHMDFAGGTSRVEAMDIFTGQTEKFSNK